MADSDAHHLSAPLPTNGAAGPSAGGGVGESLSLPFSSSKRQRRPSVRLGDIGDHSTAVPSVPYSQRTKHWKQSSACFAAGDHLRLPLPLPPKVSSHTRTVANTLAGEDYCEAVLKDLPSSSTAAAEDRALLPIDENLEPLAASIRRARDAKSRKLTVKRMRSSLSSRTLKSSDRQMEDAAVDVLEEGYREFDGLRAEDSESPSDRRAAAAAARVRASETQDIVLAADSGERDVPFEDEGGEWNDQNGHCRSREEDGVLSWLNRLGLGRYAPVFKIHEVDDEVLPLLTLEDLKDMGISAVGSRRKMYCAIQKLKKGLS